MEIFTQVAVRMVPEVLLPETSNRLWDISPIVFEYSALAASYATRRKNTRTLAYLSINHQFAGFFDLCNVCYPVLCDGPMLPEFLADNLDARYSNGVASFAFAFRSWRQVSLDLSSSLNGRHRHCIC